WSGSARAACWYLAPAPARPRERRPPSRAAVASTSHTSFVAGCGTNAFNCLRCEVGERRAKEAAGNNGRPARGMRSKWPDNTQYFAVGYRFDDAATVFTPTVLLRRLLAQEGEQPEAAAASHRLGLMQEVARKRHAAARGRAIEAAAIFGETEAAAL